MPYRICPVGINICYIFGFTIIDWLFFFVKSAFLLASQIFLFLVFALYVSSLLLMHVSQQVYIQTTSVLTSVCRRKYENIYKALTRVVRAFNWTWVTQVCMNINFSDLYIDDLCAIIRSLKILHLMNIHRLIEMCQHLSVLNLKKPLDLQRHMHTLAHMVITYSCWSTISALQIPPPLFLYACQKTDI